MGKNVIIEPVSGDLFKALMRKIASSVAVGPAFLNVRRIVCMPLVLISGSGVSRSNFEKSMPDRNDIEASVFSSRCSRIFFRFFLCSSASWASRVTTGEQVNIALTFFGSRP